MSLFSITKIPDSYFVTIINSKFASEYVEEFVNNTSHFQINDARQLPIIIPTKEQLEQFEKVFNQAYQIQKSKFEEKITKEQAEAKLEKIESLIDQFVYQLYGLTDEEIRIVEGNS